MTEYKKLPFATITAQRSGHDNWLLRIDNIDIEKLPLEGVIYENIRYMRGGYASLNNRTLYIPKPNDRLYDTCNVTNLEWQLIKNDFKITKLVDSFSTPWCDVELHSTTIDCFVLKVTNLKNTISGFLGTRGATRYFYDKSYNFPKFIYREKYICDINFGDSGITLITKDLWEKLKNDKLCYDELVADYYWFNTELEVHSCKETCLRSINRNTDVTEIVITGVFPENFKKRLDKLQEKIPNPAIIVQNKKHIKITINSWWREQFYYRMGWLLLAIRIVQGREIHNNSIVKKQFDTFVDGDFNCPANLSLTHDKNWLYYFK